METPSLFFLLNINTPLWSSAMFIFRIKYFTQFSLILFFYLCLIQPAFSQNEVIDDEECHLIKSASGKIYTVDSHDILCLARTSKKEKTLVFTFGRWCKSCRIDLPSVIKLVKEYNLEFYVLLTDEENSYGEKAALEYLDYMKNLHRIEFETFILRDEDGSQNLKYLRFLRRITPDNFENHNGMSKHILIDKSGEVLMVTNWKDSKKYKSKLIEEKIIPLLN